MNEVKTLSKKVNYNNLNYIILRKKFLNDLSSFKAPLSLLRNIKVEKRKKKSDLNEITRGIPKHKSE